MKRRNGLLIYLILAIYCLNMFGGEFPDYLANSNNLHDLSLKQNMQLVRTYNEYAQGVKFLETNEYEKSIECFEEVYKNTVVLNDPSLHLDSTKNLAVLYSVISNHPKALKYFKETYDLSKELGNTYQWGAAANNIGAIYFKNNKINKARQYFNEGYKLSNVGGKRFKDLATFSTNYLGNIALYTDKNYTKARKLLEESYQSENIDVKSVSASHLGFIHLMGLGTKINLERAREYMYEAFEKGSPKTRETVSCDLHSMVTVLLNNFDEALEQIKEKYPSSQMKYALRSVKDARKILQQADNDIEFIEDELIRSSIKTLIKTKHEELNTIEGRIRNPKKQDKSEQVLAETENCDSQKKYIKDLKDASSIHIIQQDALKTLSNQQKMQKRASLLGEFDTLFKSCSKKTSAERIKKLETTLSEASMLITDNSEVIQIKEKRSMLNNLLDLTKEEEASTSALKQKEKVSRALQQEKYLILDPFDQVAQAPNNVIITINSHLEALREDPLNNRESEKIKSLNNTWRIRAGDYRILYTILAQRHAIGIVSIDARKDVYENQESNANREEWFRELNLATNDQIKLKIAEEKSDRKIEALKKFLQNE